jgi:hypothetical protein
MELHGQLMPASWGKAQEGNDVARDLQEKTTLQKILKEKDITRSSTRVNIASNLPKRNKKACQENPKESSITKKRRGNNVTRNSKMELQLIIQGCIIVGNYRRK